MNYETLLAKRFQVCNDNVLLFLSENSNLQQQEPTDTVS